MLTIPTSILALLAVVIVALTMWIVHDVWRRRAFSVQDAIALLGIAITAAIALMPFVSADLPIPTPAPPPPLPSINIDGPETAPLGQKTYFTLTSQNATRAEWSIGGFGDGKPFVIEPLSSSHQIYVEPTDMSRVGDSFVLAVTVYDAAGQSAGAAKRFVVTR
jgi:hypothetical protein